MDDLYRCLLCHYDVLQKGISRVRVHANTSERIMAHGQNNTGSCLCISFCWGCCLGCQLEGQMHQWYHFISMHQLASYSHWPQPISDNTSNPFDSNLLVRRNSACLSPYKYLHNISKHSKTNCKTQIIYLGTLSAMTPFIPLYSFPTWQVHKQQCGKVVMSGCLVVQDLTKALPRHGGQIGDGESGLRSCCQWSYPTQSSWVPWAPSVQAGPGKIQRALEHWVHANAHPWIWQRLVHMWVLTYVCNKPHPTNISFSLLLSAHSHACPCSGLVSSSSKMCCHLEEEKCHQLQHEGVSLKEGVIPCNSSSLDSWHPCMTSPY